MVVPAARREVVSFFRKEFRLSERRACGLVSLDRTSYRYCHRKQDDPTIRERLRELARERPRFGYRRLWVMLRREGHLINHKKVYRLYRLEGLAVRRRTRRRKACAAVRVVDAVVRPNQRWSMDFTHDGWGRRGGGRFRTLNIVDDFTRECLAIEVDVSLPAARVMRVLDQLIELRGKPEVIVVDNGPEFASKALDGWAYDNKVGLRFITPGKPVENAFIESFNGKFRDECLNYHQFKSLWHARYLIEEWRNDYNERRPHSALGNLTPREFAEGRKPFQKGASFARIAR